MIAATVFQFGTKPPIFWVPGLAGSPIFSNEGH